jgi:hypothetical protein
MSDLHSLSSTVPDQHLESSLLEGESATDANDFQDPAAAVVFTVGTTDSWLHYPAASYNFTVGTTDSSGGDARHQERNFLLSDTVRVTSTSNERSLFCPQRRSDGHTVQATRFLCGMVAAIVAVGYGLHERFTNVREFVLFKNGH